MLSPIMNKLNLSGKNRYPGPHPGDATVKAIRVLAEKAKRCNHLNKPLDQLEFTVLDTETTGFCAHEGDEIIALGAVKMSGTKLVEGAQFHRLVNPYRSIPDNITALTGIDDGMAAGGEDVFKALQELLDFTGDNVLVGHALGLDLAFINRKLKQFCNARIYNIIIDTKNIATAMYPPESATDLDSLLKLHGMDPAGRHTALGDALLTANLFGIFLEELRRKGVQTIKDLYEFLCHGDSYSVNNINRVFFHW